MEIQIPLVIFTSFLAWAAGIFGTQCILALQKRGGAVQLPALICSAVVLVVGGIAVVFHLTHPFNLFNGFGHITSGITQELIAIVLLAVAMVLFFLMLRRSEDDTVPQWLAVVGIVVVLVLIVAMGHSYMMPSLPAWDTVLQLLSLLGVACVMGPATVAFIGAVKGVEIEGIGLLTVIGAAVNAVLSAAYMFAMEASSATFQSFQYYFDPTLPDVAMRQSEQITGAILAGEHAVAFWLGNVAIGCAVPAVLAALVMTGKIPAEKALAVAVVALVCAVIGTIVWRVLLYEVAVNALIQFQWAL